MSRSGGGAPLTVWMALFVAWCAVVLTLRLLGLTAVEHSIIAGGYFLIAFGVTLTLGAALQDSAPAQAAVKLGMIAFFLGCGTTHLDLVTHYLSDTPIDYGSYHHYVAVMAQEIGGPFVALVLFGLLLSPQQRK